MIRGLYTSGYGMLTLQKKMDVTANNLANVNTTGFKKDAIVFEAFPDLLASRLHDGSDAPTFSQPIGKMNLFNNLGEVYTNFSQGTFDQTGTTTDMAISGDDQAFFVVARPDEGNATGAGTATGNAAAIGANSQQATEYLTRDGSFFVNAAGKLVNRDGYPVMGENGEISLASSDFTVQPDGTILQNDLVVDRLRIRHIDNVETLRKFGENLIDTTEETTESAFTGGVLQGSLEMSNVDSVREMVDMITVMRAYEANAKMVQTADSTLDKAVNEVGRT